MNLQKLRRAAGMLLMVLSMGLLAWSAWPLARETRQLSLDPEALLLADEGAAAAGRRLGAQELRLAWPADLRVGEVGEVWLEIGAPEAGPLSAGGAGPVVVLAEARLEMGGMQYQPVGKVSEAWLPGQPVRFVWRLRADEPGNYSGTLWLHVQPVMQNGTLLVRKVVTAQRIEVQAHGLLGLNGPSARLLGIVFGLAGMALALDGLAMRLIKRLAGGDAREN